MVFFQLFILFLLGLIFGSFLNVVVLRLRQGKTLLGRSACVACASGIRWYDTIPLVSFVLLSGDCRDCKTPISLQYPIVEAWTGLAFAALFFLHGGISALLIRDLVILMVLTVLFVYDFLYQELPDSITLPAIAVFFVWNGLFGFLGWWEMLWGAAAAGGFFLMQYVLSRGKWIGGGDVRLGVLMGVLLGFPVVLVALFLAYVGGALFGAVLLAAKRRQRTDAVAFGTFLSMATVVCLFAGSAIVEWYMQLVS